MNIILKFDINAATILDVNYGENLVVLQTPTTDGPFVELGRDQHEALHIFLNHFDDPLQRQLMHAAIEEQLFDVAKILWLRRSIRQIEA